MIFKLLLVSFSISVGFLAGWLPYAIFSLWTMFNDVSNMSPTVAILAPLFAKSTSVWNPLIYAVRNREVRQAMLLFLKRCCKIKSTASANGHHREIQLPSLPVGLNELYIESSIV